MTQIYSARISAIMLALAASAPAMGEPGSIRLQGPTQSVDVPLTGLARNEDAIALATRIQDNQAKLTSWRQTLDPKSDGAMRLSVLAAKIQDESIGDLREGYAVASNTSGSFPGKTKGNIDVLQQLIESITARPQAEDRVVTHISTTVAEATIHYRLYESAPDAWTTYSDGELMDVGGYYFRVSNTKGINFQELYVVRDNPSSHKISP